MSTTLTTQIEEAQAVLSAATTVRDRAWSAFYAADTALAYKEVSGENCSQDREHVMEVLAEAERATKQAAAAERILLTLQQAEELHAKVNEMASKLFANPLTVEDRCQFCGDLSVNCSCELSADYRNTIAAICTESARSGFVQWQYTAWVHGQEEEFGTGTGRTEEDAIEDLLTYVQDWYLKVADRRRREGRPV